MGVVCVGLMRPWLMPDRVLGDRGLSLQCCCCHAAVLLPARGWPAAEPVIGGDCNRAVFAAGAHAVEAAR